jgi:hypothetical protein
MVQAKMAVVASKRGVKKLQGILGEYTTSLAAWRDEGVLTGEVYEAWLARVNKMQRKLADAYSKM